MVGNEERFDRLLVHAEQRGDAGGVARRGHGGDIRERLQLRCLCARRVIHHARHGRVGEHLVVEEAREGGDRHRAAAVRAAVLHIVVEQQLLCVRCVHAEKFSQRLRRALLRERRGIGELHQRLEVCRQALVDVRREGGVVGDVLRQEAQKLRRRHGHALPAAVHVVVDHAEHIGADRDAGLERADGVGHLLGGALAAERGGIGHGTLDVRVVLEPVGQRGDGRLVLIVIQHHERIVRRKHLGHGVWVGERVGDLRRQLQDIRSGKQQHERRRDHAAPAVAEAPEPREHALALALGCARLFHRLTDDLIRPQDQPRQHREHAQQAEQHALGQHDAEIHADLKAHEHQHQQSDDRRDRAAGDRAEGRRERARHGTLAVVALGQLLPVAVHEDDGVVHRERELQNGRDARRDVRRLAEEDIRALVEQHRHADRQQKQHRLKVRRAGDEQDRRHKHDREDEHDRRNARRRGIVAAHGHIIAGKALGHVALDLRLLVGIVVIER